MVRIDKFKNWIIYFLLLVVIVYLWQHYGQNNDKLRLMISTPYLIFKYFRENYLQLLIATKATMSAAVIGLVIATSFSFIMMIICFSVPKFMNFVMPLMITTQVVPLIVLAPFFIILLGPNISSKIAMAAVISFFPVFINFAQGFESINKVIHEFMYIQNASLFFRIFKVYFPLSLSNIFAGLKVSATLSIIGAIVAEFSGANVGLGKNLFISALRLEPELMMCSLFLSTLAGLLLFYIIRGIEISLTKWK
jgi:NitT/TauT family transport system permease protein